MSLEADFLGAFEVHSPEGIRDALAAGASPTDLIKGKTPVDCLIEGYLRSPRLLELLVEAGAELDVRLKGLVWGPGADWETLVLDMTPISYAQCGLYAQFHRREQDVYSNLTYLYQRRHGATLQTRNVPKRYLAPRS